MIDSFSVPFKPVTLCYEYFLTVEDEIKFFWGRKISSVKVLFLFNRYFPLLANILVMVHNFALLPQKVCTSTSLSLMASSSVANVPVTVRALLLCRSKLPLCIHHRLALGARD